MASRSPYFEEKFNGEWENLTVITMPMSVDPAVFKRIINYFYLRTHAVLNDSYAIQDQLLKLARMYELDDLVDGIEEIKELKTKKQEPR